MSISQSGLPVELQMLFSCEMHRLDNAVVSLYNDQAGANRGYLVDVCYVRFVKFRLSDFDYYGILQLDNGEWSSRERYPS